MAKPRVFVSSTYYDLKYIRAGIESFIKNLGYDVVLFEKGDIPFHHDVTLEEACYQEIDNADMLVLIVGGRYGALSKEDESALKSKPDEYFGRIRSITNKEYEKARKKNIAIFIFVEQSVFSEYRTYKENKTNKSIKYAHVDDPRIYEMIEDILVQKKNNFIREFSTIEDITIWLRDQWAGIFVDLLRRSNVNAQIKSLENQIGDLTDAIKTLKSYNEEIVKAVSKTDSDSIIRREHKRSSNSRAKRFVEEPLPGFISSIMSGRDSLKSPTEILEAFILSKTVKEFFKLSGFDEKNSKEYAENLGPVAEEEYKDLKKRYSIDTEL